MGDVIDVCGSAISRITRLQERILNGQTALETVDQLDDIKILLAERVHDDIHESGGSSGEISSREGIGAGLIGDGTGGKGFQMNRVRVCKGGRGKGGRGKGVCDAATQGGGELGGKTETPSGKGECESAETPSPLGESDETQLGKRLGDDDITWCEASHRWRNALGRYCKPPLD